jgi:hypothetical protein
VKALDDLYFPCPLRSPAARIGNRPGRRVLVNVYRWDLERKNHLDAPLDIGLCMKLIEELEKMKTGCCP